MVNIDDEPLNKEARVVDGNWTSELPLQQLQVRSTRPFIFVAAWKVGPTLGFAGGEQAGNVNNVNSETVLGKVPAKYNGGNNATTFPATTKDGRAYPDDMHELRVMRLKRRSLPNIPVVITRRRFPHQPKMVGHMQMLCMTKMFEEKEQSLRIPPRKIR